MTSPGNGKRNNELKVFETRVPFSRKEGTSNVGWEHILVEIGSTNSSDSSNRITANHGNKA